MPFKSKAQQRKCYASKDPKWDCAEFSETTDFAKLPERTKRAAVTWSALRYLQSLQPAGIKTASAAPLRTLMLKIASGIPLMSAIAQSLPGAKHDHIVKLASLIIKGALDGVHNDGNLQPCSASEAPRPYKMAPQGDYHGQDKAEGFRQMS